jgi:O-acetyl-ADP-ribose deacetylase (regulator of RNase III)
MPMTETSVGTSVRFGRTTLVALRGELIEQPVEAIVIAANQRGVIGTGAAGAVRVAGGPAIEREAMEQAPLALGGAVATTSGKLAERGISLIVHAVVTERLAEASTLDLVRRAMVAALALAEERRVRSLAVPAVGSGSGPQQLRTDAVVEAVVDETIAHLRRTQTRLDRVVFVARDEDDVAAFAEAITRGRERSWRQAL